MRARALPKIGRLTGTLRVAGAYAFRGTRLLGQLGWRYALAHRSSRFTPYLPAVAFALFWLIHPFNPLGFGILEGVAFFLARSLKEKNLKPWMVKHVVQYHLRRAFQIGVAAALAALITDHVGHGWLLIPALLALLVFRMVRESEKPEESGNRPVPRRTR